MPEWKKVIVSGSQAELNNLVVDNHVSASLFSGSFYGDGSNLTGLDVAINSYTNAADNRVITSVDGTTVNGEANLTFDGSTLTVTGDASITGNTTLGDASGDSVTINAATIDVPNIAAGTDNSVVVYNGSTLVTDEIDSRVWGATLLDNNGTPLTSGRVPYATDGDSLIDSANLTFNGTTLTANSATITNDLTVGGDLIVNGDVTNINTTNLNVEDRFILINSGSVASDSGIIFGGVTSGTSGASFFYDNDTTRLAYTAASVASNATSATPSGYITVVYDVTGASHTPEDKIGNMKVESSEIFIYV